VKSLDAVVAAQKRGEARGIASICSAHPVALDAAMRHAAGLASPLLVEATCNQVNQFGGYTGMQPADFVRYVHGIAAKAGLPVEDLLLGGDHLGPLVWANEPAQAAMEKAKALVRAYAAAGFGKIHLDCSMPCADDAELPVEVIARRAAELAQAAEEVAGSRAPRYVIGSEVPPAGGARSGDSGLSVTRPEAAAETIEITRQAFVRLRLEAAWERVVALVVQPGVEFGDEDVHEYDRSQATGLARLIETCVSFAISKSAQPSPFTSSTATPSPLELASYMPTLRVTSSNFPPALCHTRTDAPLYDSGVQYDLLLPSSVQ
jgi:D-tagatose-1,6-bisphosphate aldolase subunit GatZ/KbaZ